MAAGGAVFLAADDRNRRIGARVRAALAAGREALLALCRSTSGYRSYGEEEDAAAPMRRLRSAAARNCAPPAATLWQREPANSPRSP